MPVKSCLKGKVSSLSGSSLSVNLSENTFRPTEHDGVGNLEAGFYVVHFFKTRQMLPVQGLPEYFFRFFIRMNAPQFRQNIRTYSLLNHLRLIS